MELAVLEMEQENPERGPEGRKGQTLAVGKDFMAERERLLS